MLSSNWNINRLVCINLYTLPPEHFLFTQKHPVCFLKTSSLKANSPKHRCYRCAWGFRKFMFLLCDMCGILCHLVVLEHNNLVPWSTCLRACLDQKYSSHLLSPLPPSKHRVMLVFLLFRIMAILILKKKELCLYYFSIRADGVFWRRPINFF